MASAPRIRDLSLNDGSEAFEVVVLEPARPICTVLFSTGRGGNPQKHFALLQALAEAGCQVIAPRLEMFASPVPVKEELLSRLRKLHLAVQSAAQGDLPIVGLGHSVGATILLILAGARAWTFAREEVASEAAIEFAKLLLLAPATDFFKGPNALDLVQTPIVVWAGTNDMVTPPPQAAFLREVLDARSGVEVRLMTGAGHFTFMNELPAQVSDPYPDREAFLANLAGEVCRVATNQAPEIGKERAETDGRLADIGGTDALDAGRRHVGPRLRQ